MKIISSLIGLVVLLIVGVVLCHIFFNVNYSPEGYDVLICSKDENPKHFVGVRYKGEFMIHVFTKKSMGDTLGAMFDNWQRKSAEDARSNEKP